MKSAARVAFAFALSVLLPAALVASPVTIAYESHDGYFVSNKFEPQAATSFLVVQDQAAFDRIFGAAVVMYDKAHRLAPNAFKKRFIVAAIHRGNALVTYHVENVALEGRTLDLRYATKSEPSNTAQFACPLIVSVPRGNYSAVRFMEDGRTVRTIAVPSHL